MFGQGGWIEPREYHWHCGVCLLRYSHYSRMQAVSRDSGSVFPDGFMDAAVRPTSANPTMQGVIAVIALAANVICLAAIIKSKTAEEESL